MSIFYLFDFDGTLVDSMPTFVSAMLRILDENHIPYGPELTKTITPLGLGGTAEYFINTMGVNMSKDQLLELMYKYMLDAYLHTVQAKPHVIPVLQTLRQQGASLNILTANAHAALDPCLKRLGMWELFDNVWSCDDFHTTKADPDIYRQAAERLHTTVENVLFFDDNLHADTTAKAAGMRVCGVYDPSSDDSVDQIKAITDHYIYNFSELPNLA